MIQNMLNHTHDPSLKSWVASANIDGTDFPIQNLPFAVFKRKNSHESFRGGVAIGNQIIDLAAISKAGVLDENIKQELLACSETTLNSFMEMGRNSWSAVRHALSESLAVGSASEKIMSQYLVPQSEVKYTVPAKIGDYTDFYTSINHATNIGKMFRPDNPLLPNYQWVPIGYHGRSSSIVVSGEAFHRPKGQLKPPTAKEPELAPCKRLDYELEVGIYIGKETIMGESIPLDKADEHVFGLCLFNDWSARDIQAWEYQPLGPFLAKNFASTVSPWIITSEALAPFRSPWKRDEEHPKPLPYLSSKQHSDTAAIDMSLEVLIQTKKMRASGAEAETIAKSNFIDSYWSVAQMVAHHSVNGCNMRAGDFFGSGTQSGKSLDQVGSMMESSQGGTVPIEFKNGESRTFLEDGDSVILKGHCQRKGYVSIGFGEAEGTVMPAINH